MTALLVVGGSGFLGSHTAQSLLRRDDVTVRWALHRRPLHQLPPAHHDIRMIDLTDAGSLDGLAEGIDAVLNLGHLITGTWAELAAVNTDGIANLLAECRAAGVRRFVQLSTAAIYPSGPWRGQDPARLPSEPRSPTSITRLAGDRLVLDHGGVVVRPHLVYGPGDRWFVPRALSMIERLGWIEEGAALHSLISAQELSVRLLRLAVGPEVIRGGVLFAADPEPMSMRAFLTDRLRSLGRPVPRHSISLAEAYRHRPAGDDARWDHDVALLAQDHYLDARVFHHLSGSDGEAAVDAVEACAHEPPAGTRPADPFASGRPSCGRAAPKPAPGRPPHRRAG
jgi:nucleoside-diphosphate-sugar epimerase